MPTIKCIKKPVIRPRINATIIITDRSNGENFIVGKSLKTKSYRINRGKKIYLLVEQSYAFPLENDK
jgi:hypothetical protein